MSIIKFISELEDCNQNIKAGDILIFSKCKAYMIIKNQFEYLATQIFNNGNEILGYVDYTDKTIEQLIEKLINDHGLPKHIVNMKDVSLSIN